MNQKDMILIIDDDTGFRKTLSDLLVVQGFEPVAVPGGEEALEMFTWIWPTVALIDLRM